jgi:hypothetical protein
MILAWAQKKQDSVDNVHASETQKRHHWMIWTYNRRKLRLGRVRGRRLALAEASELKILGDNQGHNAKIRTDTNAKAIRIKTNLKIELCDSNLVCRRHFSLR